MASSQEKGVLNFIAECSKMNITVSGFGSSYSPPDRLKLTNLQDTLAKATQLLSELNLAISANKNAISVRAAAYETLPSRITRVVNFFSITNADNTLKANVKSVAAKFRSSSKKSKDSKQDTTVVAVENAGVNETAETAKTAKTRSNAQTGFDNKLGHLRLTIALVETEPSYSPAEVDLTVASLNNFASELEQCNLMVAETQSRLNALRKQRDELIYGKTNSLLSLGHDVKKYVRAAYGNNSNEAMAINAIRLG